MCRRVLRGLIALLMLGTLMALVPSAWATPLPSAGAATAKPDPFTVLWTQNNPTGWAIPMRLGRDRSKPSLWGDGYDNFGLVHVHKGHVGHGKNWQSTALMVAQVKRALESPTASFPISTPPTSLITSDVTNTVLSASGYELPSRSWSTRESSWTVFLSASKRPGKR
jgi:hypothetical protein